VFWTVEYSGHGYNKCPDGHPPPDPDLSPPVVLSLILGCFTLLDNLRYLIHLSFFHGLVTVGSLCGLRNLLKTFRSSGELATMYRFRDMDTEGV
jgi:hypothetical protein